MYVQLQGLAYIMLIARAKTDSTNGSVRGYSMASVTGAMYLLVASTTPDLRAGFTLLVDGLRFYQNVFGAALLTLYGLMICAAMKVLFTTSNDDTSVVINAVTVLFIADVVSLAVNSSLRAVFNETCSDFALPKWKSFEIWTFAEVASIYAKLRLGYLHNPSFESLWKLGFSFAFWTRYFDS